MRVVFATGVADFVRERGNSVLITVYFTNSGCCTGMPIPQVDLKKPEQGASRFVRAEVEGVEVYYPPELDLYPSARVSLNRFFKWRRLAVRLQGVF